MWIYDPTQHHHNHTDKGTDDFLTEKYMIKTAAMFKNTK